MPALPSPDIRGIVFDLDGTLYVCNAFADTIQDAANAYIAGLLGIKQTQAFQLMADTRARLTREHGSVQTLSAVCAELGGDIRALHRHFEEVLQPEEYLVRDLRVIGLMTSLARHFSLYVYTNNNRGLATRIISHLGLEGLFRQVFAIDDAWRSKPDERMLAEILEKTGLAPAEALFVGDRYDVDLRVPEQYGCPVYLSRTVEQLLRLEELLASRAEPV
ncbi:MAG: hypothetical protein A2X82_03945 [Geobacteraceae bacterium GWC2_55_20]|nr:MAG: hypothetical protein A2X82_03945 [Geobacteraceae bacterium GWC2_55_20]OGU24198.1 MAG: hypothetical protein A2X85_16470 [Geobacteraceae bacterium GWF2_54_21]HCE69119.1 HAD family hydrolase [Geobacter sp.]